MSERRCLDEVLKNRDAQHAQAGSLKTPYHKEQARRFVKHKMPVHEKRHCFQIVEILMCPNGTGVNERIQAGALDRDKKPRSWHRRASSIPPYSKRIGKILNGFQKFFNAEQAMLYNSLPSPHRREKEGVRGKLRIEAGGSLGGYRKSSLVFPLLSTPYSCTVGEGCPPAKECSALVLLSISGPPCRAETGTTWTEAPVSPADG